MSVSGVKHPMRNQAVYYAMKGAGAALVAGGAAIAVAGSIYTWPKVTHIIGSALKGMPTETGVALGRWLSNLIVIFAKALAGCSQIRGDIGGFLALGVLAVGISVTIGPIIIAYGLPIISGYLVGAFGLTLWRKADEWAIPEEEIEEISPPILPNKTSPSA